MKHHLLIALLFSAWLLAGCSPNALVAPSPAATSMPGTSVLPSPAASSAPLSEADLKYRLLAQYPDFFYCDPNSFPVARAIDPVQVAQQRLPEIEADSEVFQGILRYNGLTGLTSFSSDQVVLIYSDYKKLAAIQMQPGDRGYPLQIVTASGKSQRLRIEGRIDNAGNITVQSKTPTFATCPICLSAQSRIDTPRGPVTVTDLKVGDLVWTLRAGGQRVAEPILEVSRTPVPPTHEMVHLVLSDGRELLASPGHPMADGRLLGDLRAGDTLDRARVTLTERVPNGLPATYDLLPAGGTGFYWANGILLGSTLSKPWAPDRWAYAQREDGMRPAGGWECTVGTFPNSPQGRSIKGISREYS